MQGKEAKKAKDYEKTLALWTEGAENEKALSEQTLGWLYLKGGIVTQDYEKSLYWFKKAAAQGDKGALYMLGVIYFDGNKGLPQDTHKAFYWWGESWKAGSMIARSELYHRAPERAEKIERDLKNERRAREQQDRELIARYDRQAQIYQGITGILQQSDQQMQDITQQAIQQRQRQEQGQQPQTFQEQYMANLRQQAQPQRTESRVVDGRLDTGVKIVQVHSYDETFGTSRINTYNSCERTIIIPNYCTSKGFDLFRNAPIDKHTFYGH